VNEACQPRSGTIKVVADSAVDSPAEMSVTQAANDTPALSLTPSNREVPKQAGSTTFKVSNTGCGTMEWEAAVLSGDGWLDITSGSNGTDDGTIEISYSQNMLAEPRTGIIRVTAPQTNGSPFDVTINQTRNGRPVADAGPDQRRIFGKIVTLDGSGSSDVDGDALTFLWSFSAKPEESAAELDDPTAISPAFAVDAFGDYVVQLIVNDGTHDSAPDTVIVTTENTPPIADAGPDRSGHPGDEILLDGRDSRDPDGRPAPLTFAWHIVTAPEGSTAALDAPMTETPRLAVDLLGDYVIQLVVNDGAADSAPDTVMVSAVNTRPVAQAGQDVPGVALGERVELDGTGSWDDDGDPLSFAWSVTARPPDSAATLTDAATDAPNITPDVAGDYLVQLIVHDGYMQSAPDSVRIAVQADENG